MLIASVAIAFGASLALSGLARRADKAWLGGRARTRAAWVVAAALFLAPALHCGDSSTQAPEAAPAEAPEPAAAPAPEPAAAPDTSDPNWEAKAKIDEARRHYEAATDPIDLDVYRVEYALVLRTELEKVGLPKNALDRMSLRELTERARRKDLMD